MEVLQILLGPERAVEGDPLGRSALGWRTGMTEAEAWEAGRGVWKFKTDRALAQEVAQVVNAQGTVLAVATITGISKHGDRFALEGRLLVGDARVGRPTATPHRSRNSIAYF
ncbi:hypothetical protein [Streptomyces sp. H39-S7]|uniref:hypothetical protein n=1 Tax=Streptomyces sp. H39-S7 TaxID=3004357 RepID=UPI0022AE5987|nr:hypothetical protein [Streptomyces sp. H39-S7]MCZ4120286.1 hypothetical protein [Streptomyces sp. H39-S7]